MSTLQWLYNTLTTLHYQNLVLLYQDISLILTINPKTTISTTKSNTLQITINNISIAFPIDYPTSPPIVSPHTPNLHLQQWYTLYANQTTNQGIPPKQNRLLQLYLSLQQPLLPPKPKQKPQQQSPVTPVTPVVPTLPVNPIRQQLTNQLQSNMTQLWDTHVSNKSTDIRTTQTKLINTKNTLVQTAQYVDEINKAIDFSVPIITERLEQSANVTKQIQDYVDSDYNHELQLVKLDENSTNLAKINAFNDTLHFLNLLFENQKISISDYIFKSRKISRDKAKLIIQNFPL